MMFASGTPAVLLMNMGFLDRFSARKSEPSAAPAVSSDSIPSPLQQSSAASVKPRLAAAREKIEAKDLPAAMTIYEELLASSGDRADVLVAISGDLGSCGHVAEIIELVAPRYDADRHGPATGLNLLQAYLAVRNADAAQHVLDILFGLNRPELEDRLHGFSNAIAEILASPMTTEPGGGMSSDAAKIGLITIGKPIWFYGLESMAAQILPPKEGRLRRIAFAQLALPGHGNKTAAAAQEAEDELGRLSRAIPLWFAETFYFSPSYAPSAAIAILTPPEGASRYVNFGAEWATENLRQLVETTEGGLDYIVSGALRGTSGDYEVQLRVWEVKTYRERKTFSVRWTPSTADAALTQLHTQVRMYMEWSPSSAAFAYTTPPQPRPWLETLEAALGLFLLEKTILAREQLASVEEDVKQVTGRAAASEAASLASLTFRSRAARLGFATAPEPALAARSPLVLQAQKALN
ncbi:MAG: hypothetical protein ACREH8_08780 [Opitutaceae bacterium]